MTNLNPVLFAISFKPEPWEIVLLFCILLAVVCAGVFLPDIMRKSSIRGRIATVGTRLTNLDYLIGNKDYDAAAGLHRRALMAMAEGREDDARDLVSLAEEKLTEATKQ